MTNEQQRAEKMAKYLETIYAGVFMGDSSKSPSDYIATQLREYGEEVREEIAAVDKSVISLVNEGNIRELTDTHNELLQLICSAPSPALALHHALSTAVRRATSTPPGEIKR